MFRILHVTCSLETAESFLSNDVYNFSYSTIFSELARVKKDFAILHESFFSFKDFPRPKIPKKKK